MTLFFFMSKMMIDLPEMKDIKMEAKVGNNKRGLNQSLNQNKQLRKASHKMNNSRLYESSPRQDYVMTSTTNQIQTDNNYLSPLSPNIYQLNYQKIYFDAEHVLSSSPKMAYQGHDITPHPMNLSQIDSKKKEGLRFDSDNKENIQTNFNLFEPMEYEKMFQKKIDFSQIGLSSNKKSPQSIGSGSKFSQSIRQNKNSPYSMSSNKQFNKSISQLSNQSKNFIQRSIKQNIISNSSESNRSDRTSKKGYESDKSNSKSLNQSLKQQMRLFQFYFNEVESIPVTSSNETIQTKSNQNFDGPSSSSRQQNTYSTGQVNLESIQQAQNHENQREMEEVPSFNQKQEIIDYFLTQQDDPNEHNDSEQGIQLLSELKSELNSLINGSAENSQASSNNVSKHGRTLHEIRPFGNRSNPESAVSKRCNSACEQLGSKIEELKMNIMALHSKISTSTNSTQKAIETQQSCHGSQQKIQSWKKGAKAIKKQPEIYLQGFKEQKNSKKLIYPDSQIIFSRNDGQFVDFNDEFSKIMGQSYDQQHSQNSHHIASKQILQSSPRPSSHKKSRNHQNQSKIQISVQNSLMDTQYKNRGNQTDKFDTSSKQTPIKIEIQKQAFKMSYPKFYDIEKSPSVDLGNSYLSSTSNDAFMLQEINSKFNSRFNQFFQARN